MTPAIHNNSNAKPLAHNEIQRLAPIENSSGAAAERQARNIINRLIGQLPIQQLPTDVVAGLYEAVDGPKKIPFSQLRDFRQALVGILRGITKEVRDLDDGIIQCFPQHRPIDSLRLADKIRQVLREYCTVRSGHLEHKASSISKLNHKILEHNLRKEILKATNTGVRILNGAIGVSLPGISPTLFALQNERTRTLDKNDIRKNVAKILEAANIVPETISKSAAHSLASLQHRWASAMSV